MTWLKLWYLFTFIGMFSATISAYPQGIWAMVQASFLYISVWLLGYYVHEAQTEKS